MPVLLHSLQACMAASGVPAWSAPPAGWNKGVTSMGGDLLSGLEDVWRATVQCPATERLEKPRSSGLTMVIDKGLGCSQLADWVDLVGPYVDFVKFGFGTARLYSESVLRRKIELLRSRDIHVYPGGTLLEIAYVQGSALAYLERARELGFSAIEVSDGTIELSPTERASLIELAASLGFLVLSEVGKKDPRRALEATKVHRQVRDDLAAGASYVVIEARDAGVGIGVYDEHGELRESLADAILAGVEQPERLIWEAPRVPQQQRWLTKLGCNVNLGNVQAEDVITLEAMRRALRGDTLRLRVAAASAR